MYSIDKKKKNIFLKKLFNWHKKNYRNFPWRRTDDPFHIIIAEIMLQKTDAKKVDSVFNPFISKYPTPLALSKAEIKEIRKDIQILGIHKRAERMKNLAKNIVEKHNGNVPSKKEELVDLLGVGDYIANAVLCFAFNEDSALLDTNVARILERIFSIKTTKSRARTDKELWETAKNIIPIGSGREFNFAMLDFSALICKARKPLHDECPMQDICVYYNSTMKG